MEVLHPFLHRRQLHLHIPHHIRHRRQLMPGPNQSEQTFLTSARFRRHVQIRYLIVSVHAANVVGEVVAGELEIRG
jgi:hypothetical protein